MVCIFKRSICFILIPEFPVKDGIVWDIIMNLGCTILDCCFWIYNCVQNFIIDFDCSGGILGFAYVFSYYQSYGITNMSYLINCQNRMARLFHCIAVLKINLPSTNRPYYSSVFNVFSCKNVYYTIHCFSSRNINAD